MSKNKFEAENHHEGILSGGRVIYDIKLFLEIMFFLWSHKMKKNIFIKFSINGVAKILTSLFIFLMPIAASLTVNNIQSENLKFFWIGIDSVSALYFTGIMVFLCSTFSKYIVNLLFFITSVFLIFIPIATTLDVVYIEKMKIEFFGLFLDLFGMAYFLIILLALHRNLKKTNNIDS